VVASVACAVLKSRAGRRISDSTPLPAVVPTTPTGVLRLPGTGTIRSSIPRPACAGLTGAIFVVRPPDAAPCWNALYAISGWLVAPGIPAGTAWRSPGAEPGLFFARQIGGVPFALYGLPNRTLVPPAGKLSGSGRATRCPTEELRDGLYGADCPSAFKPH
jgi:hypothetical protein